MEEVQANYRLGFGHRADMFFIMKGEFIHQVRYNLDKTRLEIQALNASVRPKIEVMKPQEVTNEVNSKENGLD